MSQRIVLLDTNLLIAALDKQASTSDEVKEQAKKKLTTLLQDESVKIAITPLIRYEVLRGIAWGHPEKLHELQETLNQFAELDITRDISELSANLYRFDKHHNPNKNVDKRKFDVFHFASAKLYQVSLESADGDMEGLEKVYRAYVQEVKAYE